MTTQIRTYNLPPELVEHFSNNIAYFKKLLSKDFSDLNVNVTPEDIKKIEKSFEVSHRIRDFEINLYWQRLNFLWAITALLFAGWGALIFKIIEFNGGEAPYIMFASLSFLSLIGGIVTIFTSFIIEAGKHWQKVWEYHVYALEPFVSGHLYAIQFSYKNKQRASISRSVETFNYALLFLWACSAVFAAIIPSQIGNGLAGIIQLVISLLIAGAFVYIRNSVTKKESVNIQLD